jgi:hypothetical protein
MMIFVGANIGRQNAGMSRTKDRLIQENDAAVSLVEEMARIGTKETATKPMPAADCQKGIKPPAEGRKPPALTPTPPAPVPRMRNRSSVRSGADTFCPAPKCRCRVRLGESTEPKSERSGLKPVKAWRMRQLIAGKEREAVVLFSPQMYEGQVRGLHQRLERCWREVEQMGRQTSMSAAQRSSSSLH